VTNGTIVRGPAGFYVVGLSQTTGNPNELYFPDDGSAPTSRSLGTAVYPTLANDPDGTVDVLRFEATGARSGKIDPTTLGTFDAASLPSVPAFSAAIPLLGADTWWTKGRAVSLWESGTSNLGLVVIDSISGVMVAQDVGPRFAANAKVKKQSNASFTGSGAFYGNVAWVEQTPSTSGQAHEVLLTNALACH
jgi:hypothetical protein